MSLFLRLLIVFIILLVIIIAGVFIAGSGMSPQTRTIEQQVPYHSEQN